MRSRILFLAIVSFWMTMNFLLWRSQWAAHSQIGNAVPVEVVWERMLTAPDSSALDIYDHDKRIGVCHWTANVGNSPLASNKILSDDYAPDGFGETVTGYSLLFEGNAMLANSNRIRFEASLDLSTNRAWKNFHARLSMRPVVWDVRAVAAAQKMTLAVEDHGVNWQKTLSFAELRDPEALWTDLGGTSALSLMAGMGMAPSAESMKGLAASVNLQAHEDWIQFGHSKARAYRLETVFFGRRISLITSRAGEILQVDLPGDIRLRNEALENF